MKRLILALVGLVASLSLFAQTDLERFERQFPDSLIYVMPEFMPGRVVYKNGQYSNGIFNIATIDQTLRFRTDGGETLALKDNRDVDRVTIGKSLFLHLNNEYAQVVGVSDDVILCVTKKLVFKKDAKKGAFGMTSETTSISSVSNYTEELGSTYNLSSQAEHRMVQAPILVKKNRQYPFNRKSLEKLFPDKKAALADYLAANSVNFDNPADATALFSALK